MLSVDESGVQERRGLGRASVALSDFTHVLHSAVDRGEDGDFNRAIEINTNAVGQIKTHARNAESLSPGVRIGVDELYAPHRRQQRAGTDAGRRRR